MKKILLSVALGFVALSLLLAQENKSYQITQRSENGTPSFIKFDANTDVTHENFFEKMKGEFGFQTGDKFVLLKTTKDKIGFTHYEYSQQYNGINIFGLQFVIHEKASVVNSANGKFIPNLSIDTEPTISKEEAIKNAMKELDLGKYIWEGKNFERVSKENVENPINTYYPHPELVIEPVNGNYKKNEFRLCWMFDVAGASDKEYTVFIDAQTGRLINKISLIYNADASGSTVTKYNGVQNITCDFDGANTYTFYESGTRGLAHSQVIFTADANHDILPSILTSSGIISETSSTFTIDSFAGSVQWGIEKTYDFYYSTFARQSYNDSSSDIKSYIHYSSDDNNCGWSKMFGVMIYGDGDGINMGPFCSLDMIGHEFSHAFTDRTCKLVNQGESGALNESFSDIMGTGVEHYAYPSTFNWYIGDNIPLIAPYYFRSMNDPKHGPYVPGLPNGRQPSTYQGTYWAPTNADSSDAGGVHINCGVQNYWFYLLSQGGSGTIDDAGTTSYNVNGIGIDSALQIIYLAYASAYVHNSDGYNEAMTATITAAEVLYGNGSPKVQSVKDAWCAVGLGVGCSVNGINEPDNGFSVSVYPNPASNTVTIVSDGKPILVNVYDLAGREILSTQLNGSTNNLDVSKVSKGMYVVRIQEGERKYQTKFVKQ